MDAKRLMLGTVAGGVVLFFLGFILYALAFEGFFKENMGPATNFIKDPPNFPFIILADLAGGLLLAYIYDRWAGIKTFNTGLKAALVIGLAVALYAHFLDFGTNNKHSMNSAIVAIILDTIRMGLAGGVVGWVLGRGSKT